MKRAFDIIAVLLTAPIWIPLAMLVALAVRIADGSPVLFVAERAGLGGKAFRFLKFRTMREGEGDDASRTTRFGGFLRRSSLDELPQLLHVLSGKMSLVGPRPLPTSYLTRYSSSQARRHEVRPGITGLAQVNGRNLLDWDEKLRLDVEYVDNHSLAMDVKILFLTFFRVFSAQGVNHADGVTMPEFKPEISKI